MTVPETKTPGSDRITRVLVTGAGGSVGRALVRLLAAEPGALARVVATDLRAPELSGAAAGGACGGAAFISEALDVTDRAAVDAAVARHGIDAVVHLAAVVRGGMPREAQYRVDVDGTRHVLAACLAHGVKKIVYTSSGAAYGYHPDSPPLLDEEDPLRGNRIFAYALHKRMVEEILARHREEHPQLSQLVLRVSTVLGPEVRSPITDLFEGRVVFGLAGAATPFCFVAADDVARAIALGIHAGAEGIFNVTGDGVMTLREVAREMGRPYVPLPEGLVRRALSLGRILGRGGHGPEQVLFLKHRPVLSPRRIKERLGFAPRPSREVFADYRASRAGVRRG